LNRSGPIHMYLAIVVSLLCLKHGVRHLSKTMGQSVKRLSDYCVGDNQVPRWVFPDQSRHSIIWKKKFA